MSVEVATHVVEPYGKITIDHLDFDESLTRIKENREPKYERGLNLLSAAATARKAAWLADSD